MTGKDCSICECAKCNGRYCDDRDDCPDLNNCESPVTNCPAFKAKVVTA